MVPLKLLGSVLRQCNRISFSGFPATSTIRSLLLLGVIIDVWLYIYRSETPDIFYDVIIKQLSKHPRKLQKTEELSNPKLAISHKPYGITAIPRVITKKCLLDKTVHGAPNNNVDDGAMTLSSTSTSLGETKIPFSNRGEP